MNKKTVSLIVPVYNMAGYLPELWQSLSSSGISGYLHEVIFVDDGSTDGTRGELERLSRQSQKVKVLTLTENSGRFVARHRGAESATGEYVLFLDARVSLQNGFGSAMANLLSQHEALMGMLKIDTSKSIFNLYWQRTHETIFRRHFRDAEKGFNLTAENYESYVKGTTVFLCPRSAFLKACEKYRGQPLHSDDTFLMREIVQEFPIWVDSRLAINWEPRQDYWSFWIRLWERGPQFVEYHVFARQGLYFFLFVGWTVAVFATLALLLTEPVLGATILVSGLGLIALSTALFARSPVEFFRMIPLHIGTILAYGLGAIYGVGVNLKLFRKPSPTAANK